MSAYQLYGRAIKWHRLCFLACYHGLSLAAAPSQAAPQDGHKASGDASASAPHPGQGTSPDIAIVKGEYDDTYHAVYVPPHKKHPASVLVSMHLEGSEAGAVQNGSGSFQAVTPKGNVTVKWQRKAGALGENEDGTSWDSAEFTEFIYTLTIDSPKALSVQLKTQEHDLWSVSLNGAFVRLSPHLSGQVSRTLRETQYFTDTFPGGHNVVVIQALVYYAE